jgi:hypothetical protein
VLVVFVMVTGNGESRWRGLGGHTAAWQVGLGFCSRWEQVCLSVLRVLREGGVAGVCKMGGMPPCPQRLVVALGARHSSRPVLL